MGETSAWSVATSALSIIVILLDFIKSALASVAWPATVLIAIYVFKKEMLGLLPKLASLKAGGIEAYFSQTIADIVVEPATRHQTEEHARQGTTDGPFEAPDPPAQDGQADNADDREASAEATTPRPTDSVTPNLPDLPVERDNSGAPPSEDDDEWASEYSRFVLGESAYRDFQDARRFAQASPSAAVLLAWRALETTCIKAGRHLPKRGERSMRPATIVQELTLMGKLPPPAYDRFRKLQNLRNAVAHSNEFSGSYVDVLEYITLTETLTEQVGRSIPPHKR